MRKPFLLAGAVLAVVPVGGPAEAGERQNATVLMAESEGGRKFQEELGFSDAVVTGDTIFLSGIVAGRRDGEDYGPAYERVYRHIEKVLKRAGASWDDVVDMSSFHTDVEAQIGPMAAVHKRFVKAPYPAWTAIGVSKILGNGMTEIKVVAKRPGMGPVGK